MKRSSKCVSLFFWHLAATADQNVRAGCKFLALTQNFRFKIKSHVWLRYDQEFWMGKVFWKISWKNTNFKIQLMFGKIFFDFIFARSSLFILSSICLSFFLSLSPLLCFFLSLSLSTSLSALFYSSIFFHLSQSPSFSLSFHITFLILCHPISHSHSCLLFFTNTFLSVFFTSFCAYSFSLFKLPYLSLICSLS